VLVDCVSSSLALLPEGFGVHRGTSSEPNTRLSLLVLMCMLTMFPEPADCGFAAKLEDILNAPATLRQVPLDLIQSTKRIVAYKHSKPVMTYRAVE
jgi:hypothetical protein